VIDELVGKGGPLVGGDEGHEVLFDFDGVGVGGQAETLREAGDVGIDDDADVLGEGVAEDDVGGFAADAAELGEFVHGLGDAAAVFFDDVGRRFADGFGLVAEEAGGLYELFDVFLGGFGEGLGRGVLFEEGGGDEVDADVGALGGEDGGDEELEGIFVVEGTLGVGVVLFEEGEDEVDAGLAGGGGFFGHEAPVEVFDFGFSIFDCSETAGAVEREAR
jgi:hypothetical protein